MKTLSPLALSISMIAFLATAAIADDRKPAKSEWSGFTVDQLAEHLGLKGGNIELTFEYPVYLNVQAVAKNGADKPLDIALDHWVSKPSTNYHLNFIVEDLKPKYRKKNELIHKVSVGYWQINRKPLDNPSPGVTGFTIHDIGGRFGRTFRIEAKRVGHLGAWQKHRMEAPVGTPITVYELSDADAPDDNYRKMTIRFTHSHPPHKE